MSDTVIRVENLSKQYRLGLTGTGALSHDINRIWYRIRGKEDPYLKIGEENDRTQKGSSDYVWALKDINFEVKRGEVLGIIGRNGAGKSTLLKILSRTTSPTTGHVRIKGRVASLLEVGTGFHPELSGRDNIFLNGAILGMTKKEIQKKFDEIVDFSGVERYIDTPVKRYSSGMYVRLAFAVAAHLEPDILIVDEVLAVGDAEFQKKCLGKMKDVSNEEGRTILFVSHNLAALRKICEDAIWLIHGRLAERGPIYTISERYFRAAFDHLTLGNVTRKIITLPTDTVFCLQSIALHQNGIEVGTAVVNGSPIEVQIVYEILQKIPGFRLYIDLSDEYEEVIIRSFHDGDADDRSIPEPGRYMSTAIIPSDFLAPKWYKLIVRATIHNVRTIIPEGIVIELNVENTCRLNRAYLDEPYIQKLAYNFKWKTVKNGLPCLELSTIASIL